MTIKDIGLSGMIITKKGKRPPTLPLTDLEKWCKSKIVTEQNSLENTNVSSSDNKS